MSPESWARVRRLLVVHSAPREGDALGPVLTAIRGRLPEVHVTVLAAADAPVADADETIPAPPSWLDEASVAALVDRVQAGGFDAALMLAGPGGSPHAAAYLCYLAGIPVRLGASAEFGGRALTESLAPPADADRDAHHLALLDAMGIPSSGVTTG